MHGTSKLYRLCWHCCHFSPFDYCFELLWYRDFCVILTFRNTHIHLRGLGRHYLCLKGLLAQEYLTSVCRIDHDRGYASDHLNLDTGTVHNLATGDETFEDDSYFLARIQDDIVTLATLGRFM